MVTSLLPSAGSLDMHGVVESERLAYYQTLRSLRHRGLHEGFTDVSKSQAEEAVEEARWLQDRLEAWLVDRHPELTQA